MTINAVNSASSTGLAPGVALPPPDPALIDRVKSELNGMINHTGKGGIEGESAGRKISDDASSGTRATGGVAGPSAFDPNVNGILTLGETNVTFRGGTPEQNAAVGQLMHTMYEKDPGYKKEIDAKASSGLEVKFEDLADGMAGAAEVGGNKLSFDKDILDSSKEGIANVLAHQAAQNANMGSSADLNGFVERATSVVERS